MDAGIATDDNLRLLKEKSYDWICISRGVRKAPPNRAPDSTVAHDGQTSGRGVADL